MSGKASNEASYRPSAYYFRAALRAAKTTEQAREVGLQAVKELEALKEWVRSQGLIPPRRFIMDTEAREKGLLEFTSPCEPEPPAPGAA